MMRVCKVCSQEKPLELFVKNGKFRKRTCKVCDSAKVIQYQKDNRESVLAKNKKWREENRVESDAQQKVRSARYLERFPNAAREATARWAAKSREHVLAYGREYRQRPGFKAQSAACTASRRATKLQQTPSWADHGAIDFFYASAQYMSESMQSQWDVDHIIPLKGRSARGLHTHHNLRVMPHIENMRKSNKLEHTK
jgi:hypothetical protein